MPNSLLQGTSIRVGFMPETIRIGEKLIGRDEPVYVIAEMACAHDGDIGKAKRLIDAAVSSKADAIQLQFFSRKDLMTPYHEAYDLLGKLEFSHQEWKEIYGYARRWDIHIFACTYDVPSAQLATQLGVDGIKLNSSDLSNPELLEIVARSKIPYTLGTGASTVEEIAQAIETSLQHGGDQIIIMHGVQNFPTEIESAQIHKVKILQSVFPFPVGYQDHTNASEPFSRVIDLLALGAVEVAEHFGPLKQCALIAHCFEAGLVDEMIIATIDLTWTRRASRQGDGHEQGVGVVRQEALDQRRLAGPRRRRKDEQDATADKWRPAKCCFVFHVGASSTRCSEPARASGRSPPSVPGRRA